MKRIFYLLLVLTVFVLASCKTTSNTRLSLYPKMYDVHPVTLVVMPPINNTTNVPAKELLYTSISTPLIRNGYYVVSPYIAMEMFKAESAYDAELFINNDQAIFAKVFGADAVVYSVIDKWQKQGTGIKVKIQYMIKSTRDNELIFDRTCELFLDMTSSNTSGGLIGALVNVASAAISTAVTDHIVAARKCNFYVFKDIPRGKYSPLYMNDQEQSTGKKDIVITVKQ